MRAELAGEEPAISIEIEGLPIRHKRVASSASPYASLPHRPRLAEPLTFSGKSLKELDDYEAGWKIH